MRSFFICTIPEQVIGKIGVSKPAPASATPNDLGVGLAAQPAADRKGFGLPCEGLQA
jgi:hypothetical protein